MPHDGRDEVASLRRLAMGAGFVLAAAMLAACGGPEELATASRGEAEAALRLAGPTSQGRPASVPDDFLVTPHGYFHPDCVLEVAEGEAVQDDGAVVSPEGRRRATHACAHARYDRQGHRIERGRGGEALAPPPTVNGWVASAWSMSVGPIRSISTTWRVPSAPANVGSQTLYFFPGLEPAATGAFILQPVLAWNGFRDQRWTIASWNCCTQGNVWHSSPQRVSTGDTISGSVSGSRCNEQGLCSSWSIRAAGSRGPATTLSFTANSSVLDWAFAGAVEAYGVDSCDQYPANGGVTFGSIAVRGTSGAIAAPAWNPVAGSVTPNCLSSLSAAGTSATMLWVTR